MAPSQSRGEPRRAAEGAWRGADRGHGGEVLVGVPLVVVPRRPQPQDPPHVVRRACAARARHARYGDGVVARAFAMRRHGEVCVMVVKSTGSSHERVRTREDMSGTTSAIKLSQACADTPV